MANGEFASKTATLITEIRNHLDLMSSAVADSDQFDPGSNQSCSLFFMIYQLI